MPGLQIDVQEIVDRMAYHPATPETAEKFDLLRKHAIDFARLSVELTPPSREQSLMVTHIEDALMWGSKAIARSTPSDTTETARVARVLPSEAPTAAGVPVVEQPVGDPLRRTAKCQCEDVIMAIGEKEYNEGGKTHRHAPLECTFL